jgi:hypothetical protein
VSATLRPLVGLLAALCLVLGATACSDNDEVPVDPGAVTAAATTPTALTPEQLAQVVKVSTKDLNRAARKFERCERSGIAGYGFNTCWPRAEEASAVAGNFASVLRAAQPPAEYAMLQSRLDRLAATEAIIRKGCRARDDQKCDLALMRFRDSVQKVSWELDLL